MGRPAKLKQEMVDEACASLKSEDKRLTVANVRAAVGNVVRDSTLHKLMSSRTGDTNSSSRTRHSISPTVLAALNADVSAQVAESRSTSAAERGWRTKRPGDAI